MSWSKREFVEQAYASVGYAAYTFDLSPEQIQNAVRLMDAMMATWNAVGIRVGYPIPAVPNEAVDLDAPTGVPDRANEAIYLNLGIRIAPGIGKTISPEHKQSAKAAYDALLFVAAFPKEMQLPAGTPLGAGHRSDEAGHAFSPQLEEPLDAGNDSAIDLE